MDTNTEQPVHKCIEAEQILGVKALSALSVEDRGAVVSAVHEVGGEIRFAFRALYRWRAIAVLACAAFFVLFFVSVTLVVSGFLAPWVALASLVPAGAGVAFSFLGLRDIGSDVRRLRTEILYGVPRSGD